MKKFLWMLAVILLLTSVNVSTALAEEDIFAGEPPLTQTDIDNYLKLGPEALKAVENNDIPGLSRILKPTGIDQMRAYFFYTKISCGYVMLIAPDMVDSLLSSIPPSGMPNEAELALIEKNLDAIDNLIAR